jgi:hypothetical protein
VHSTLTREVADHPLKQACLYLPPAAGMWFARDEGDGQIVRLLNASGTPGTAALAKPRQYTVTVRTGDVRGAGTDAAVFLTLYGTAGNSGALALENSKDNFERGQVDRFTVEAAVGEVQYVRIGHDNSGVAPAWHLQVGGALGQLPCIHARSMPGYAGCTHAGLSCWQPRRMHTKSLSPWSRCSW